MPSSSQFGALLRRSKFASFDPQIAQTYTSHGGYAHRGQFGFKRALPLRARRSNPAVIVEAVDTAEHQTEWKDGVNEAKWIRKWEEMDARVSEEEASPFQIRLGAQPKWEIDSEFYPKPKANVEQNRFLVKNLAAMTPKEFGKYLKFIRTQRPRFLRFLQKRRLVDRHSSSSPDSHFTLLRAAQTITEQDFLRFLAEIEAENIKSPSSTTIAGQLHPNGGLSYSETPLLQSRLINPPLPGRILANDDGKEPLKDPHLLVGVGGVIAEFNPPSTSSGPFRPFAREPKSGPGKKEERRGAGIFQIWHAGLRAAPSVVRTGGVAAGVDGVQMAVKVIEVENKADMGGNPHVPGTQEYSGHHQSIRNIKIPSPRNVASPLLGGANSPRGNDSSSRLLATLDELLDAPDGR
jgi:hypothetical protein